MSNQKENPTDLYFKSNEDYIDYMNKEGLMPVPGAGGEYKK